MEAEKLTYCAALCMWLAACGTGETPSAKRATEGPERAPTVFDPAVSTIDRARGVQGTVDEQAAEQRRRIEEASR